MALTAAQITALATELNTDPSVPPLGYAPLLTKGDWNGVRDLLNAPGPTDVFRRDITRLEVVRSIVAADFAALTQLQLSKLALLFDNSGLIDATNTNTQAIFLGIFAGMTNTVTALTALAKRKGSRAEVLFGTGTAIEKNDVLRARGLPTE